MSTLLLLLLSAVPVIAGLVRFTAFTSGAVGPDDVRFVASPGPIAVHVVAATLYAVLGALQFSASLRRRAPRWHRLAGRVLVIAGLAAALSGVWMALGYAIPASMQGPLLQGVRVVVGLSMAAALVIGTRAILRREVALHEAWMMRAYALAQGAGTQVFIVGGGGLLIGVMPLGLTRDLLMTAAWLVNVVVAEWLIRKRRRQGSTSRAIAAAAATIGSAARVAR